MENETTIHSVTAAFMQVVGAEVFLPASVVISVSDDGVNFTELKHQDFVVNKEEASSFPMFRGKEPSRDAMYVIRRVPAKNWVAGYLLMKS